MTLTDLRDALLTVTNRTYHYEKAKGENGNYIVWAEDGQAGELKADNKTLAQTISGTVDYFTRTEYDPVVQAIQSIFNQLEIDWWLNSVQREDDTHYIHYEWAWEMLVVLNG